MALKKKQKLAKQKMQKEMLKKRIIAEKEKVAGYEELARVHSAYIAILLKRLGATEDNAVSIKGKEVKEALEKYETRAKTSEDGLALYIEDIG